MVKGLIKVKYLKKYTKTLAGIKKNVYICNVFFMVLDY